jgi:hypothetical protein
VKVRSIGQCAARIVQLAVTIGELKGEGVNDGPSDFGPGIF